MSEEPTADEGQDLLKHLVNVLIAKIRGLEQENMVIKKTIANPMTMFQQSGLIKTNTPAPEDVNDNLLKNEVANFGHAHDPTIAMIPTNNEEFHNMSWADVHELAEKAME